LTNLTVTNAISGSVTGTAANVTGTVAVANGGTGTSTASPNVVFAGPTSGSTTAAPSFRALVAADIPTLNQNTTGNASTATTAGNITATSNTTLTSLSNLNTVGTITAGTWSGTAIAVEKGGTGLTTLSPNNVLLGNGTNALQVVAPGTSGNVLTSDGSTWKSTAPVASGVPYSGANAAVNLGNYDLTVNGVTVGRGNNRRSFNYVFGTNALASTIADDGTGAGNYNMAFGLNALKLNTTGKQNIAFGEIVLTNNIGGSFNTAMGVASLAINTTGSYNTGFGNSSLISNATGDKNTALGYEADVSSNNLSNTTAIGYMAKVAASNTIQLGNADITNVSTYGTLTLKDVNNNKQVTYPNTHNANAGQVLTINATGVASWSTPSTTATSVANSLTFATSGGATGSPTYNGSVARTIDYSSVGAAPSAGSTSIATVGTITTGTWSGTAIAVAKGGTGSTTASGALTNLGAAPAAGSTSITTVGTITTGTWSGTAIAVEKGGTGSTTASGALTNLGAAPAAGSTSIATVGTINTGTWQGSVIGVGYGGTGSSTATPNHVFAGPATGTLTAAPSYRALVGADIPDASATSKGGVSTGIQTFAGDKTFTGDIKALTYITTVPNLISANTAATTLDLSTGNILKVNLVANTTISVNSASVGTYILEIIQNGTYTVAWPTSNWKWSGGTAPTITATNGKTDIITIVYDGTTYFASAVQNF
jgi:hypothetical protein